MEQSAKMKGTITGRSKIGGVIQSAIANTTPYSGTYEVAPSSEKQVLHTKDLKLLDDVVVAPIPSDYGKIEWDGASLRVF